MTNQFSSDPNALSPGASPYKANDSGNKIDDLFADDSPNKNEIRQKQNSLKSSTLDEKYEDAKQRSR